MDDPGHAQAPNPETGELEHERVREPDPAPADPTPPAPAVQTQPAAAAPAQTPQEDTPDEPVAAPVPFTQWAIAQRNGAFHAEVTDALSDVVKAVEDHGKVGEITIKIRVKPGEKGTRVLLVSDDVRVRLPRGDLPSAMFFPDRAGGLHREDPMQPRLPLRTVEVPTRGELRRV